MLSPTGPSGQLFITGFMEGTSAENCGLQEEDVITAVDGERITDLPAAEASHLLSGTLNSAVTVTVLRGQGSSASSHTVALVRDVSIDVAVPTDADVGVMVWPGANGSLGDAICPYTHTHSNTHTNTASCQIFRLVPTVTR